MAKEVTLVITSCGRLDLLELTLKTFFHYNTYPITKTIIIDDSGKTQNWDPIHHTIKGPFEIIVNPKNLGQMPSIDIAYGKVTTDYIFHCEDDWEFFRRGFIEKSFEILDTNPNIFTVWLRNHTEKKIGKAIDYSEKVSLPSGDYYHMIRVHPGKTWQNGFTLNPGLRRTEHCTRFGPYAKLPIHFPKPNVNIVGEQDVSIPYREHGLRAAISSIEAGYIRHIGGKRHILLPWQI
jgi:hypothetical protein